MEKIVEKATGEKYTSKAAMAKHEKGETKSTQKKEAIKGAVKGAIKGAVKGAIKGAMKASPTKMKKC